MPFLNGESYTNLLLLYWFGEWLSNHCLARSTLWGDTPSCKCVKLTFKTSFSLKAFSSWTIKGSMDVTIITTYPACAISIATVFI